MSCDPYEIICEILGQPAHEMNNPVNEGYLCPYINSICTKRSQRSKEPFPVCSVFRKRRDDTSSIPIIVCPRRLYAADIINDVLKHCWIGEKPEKPIVVHEIKMGEVGTVDMVIADLSEDNQRIKNFISIELQAVDITGSYEPAYSSIVLDTELSQRPSYNFNYKNVQKRFITQLIDKGFYHHHWQTKIVAVVQDAIYENLKQRINFADVALEKSNVIFMQYGMFPSGNLSAGYDLCLKAVTGTTHNELMMSSLYQNAPPKEVFCEKIIKTYKAGLDRSAS